MTRSEAGKLGAQAVCGRLKKEARERYYLDPNYCKNCENIIEVRESERPCDARHRKFCSQSCSAQFNNRKRTKNSLGKPGYRDYICKCCGQLVVSKHVRQICDRCRRLGLYIPSRDESETLEEIMNRLGVKTTSDQKLRSIIVTHARQTYRRNDKEFICNICGYIKHTNVCHIRPWTKFPKTASLGEINNIDNLISLCPNHHWEFDHNLLEDKDKATLAQVGRARLL
jgi:hypothetical protein